MLLSIAAVTALVVLLTPGAFLRVFVVGAVLVDTVAAVFVMVTRGTGTVPT